MRSVVKITSERDGQDEVRPHINMMGSRGKGRSASSSTCPCPQDPTMPRRIRKDATHLPHCATTGERRSQKLNLIKQTLPAVFTDTCRLDGVRLREIQKV